MRWINAFILMAVMFGGLAEWFNTAFDDDATFSLTSATIRGTLFSIFMTGWLYHRDRKKR